MVKKLAIDKPVADFFTI